MLTQISRLSVALLFVLPLHAAEPVNFETAYDGFRTALAKQNFPEALKQAELAYHLGQEKYGNDHENTANLQFNYANMLSENQQFDAALEAYFELESRYKSLFGQDSAEMAFLYLNELNAYDSLRYDGKAPFQERINKRLRILLFSLDDMAGSERETKVSLYHETVLAIGRLGVIPFSFDSAIRFTKDAENLALNLWSDLDRRTLEIQFVLGSLYQSKGAQSLAIEQFEQVVNTFENRVTFSHPWALASRARLVDLYERSGNSDKATVHCLAIGAMTPWQDDLEPKPLYRVNPDYPNSYARMGRNGYVRVQFDINPTGFVENLQVLAVEGGDHFAEKSLEALRKWRYAPKFENGQAVVAEDLKVQLDFKID